jgi:hypothetical protein
MSTYVVIKEYPDWHRQYRLLQATPRELERVRHDRTRIIPIANIHSGIAILAEASK